MASLPSTKMSRDEAEKCLDEIRIGTLNVKAKLIELYEGRGWEALGYDSWRACIQAELKVGTSQAYRLLDAAYVEKELSPMGEKVNERQARELAKAPSGKRAEVLAKATESAAAQGRAKPTARDIKEAVDQGSNKTLPHDATSQDATRARMPAMDGSTPTQGSIDALDSKAAGVGSAAPKCGVLPAFAADDCDETGEGPSEHSTSQRGACPHGGDHSPKQDNGETFCAKCYEPLETKASGSFDFEAVNETCRFWIDTCPLDKRVELSKRLYNWAKEARSI